MKVRNCFISNSSSSSFVIKKRNLTKDQIYLIKHHNVAMKDLDLCCYDVWEINENYDHISGSTIMDNFDMEWFLKRIGVKDEYISWYEEDMLDISDDKEANYVPNPQVMNSILETIAKELSS